MAEERKSRTGLILAGLALLLGLLAAVVVRARAAIRGGAPAGGPTPQPGQPPPVIVNVTADSGAQAAAEGEFDYLEFNRAVPGASRGFVMIDPDLSPQTGEAWVVYAFSISDSDANSQSLSGSILKVDQARNIERSGFPAGSPVTLGEVPTLIKLFATSGNINESSFDQFRDQGSQMATGLRLPSFIIPPGWTFLVVEMNNVASGIDHNLRVRILFRRVRAGGTNVSDPQRSGSFTGGLGRWISSLGR